MIGAVLVTHGDLANELLRVAELIVGPQERLRAVPLAPGEDMESMRARIEAAVKEVDGGDGVIVLADMFGGTPSNLSLPFHKEGKVEVLTGVNLPMILKLASARSATPEEGEAVPGLTEIAEAVAEHARRNIRTASEILRKK